MSTQPENDQDDARTHYKGPSVGFRKAITALSAAFAVLSAMCLLVWAFAPIDDMFWNPAGTPVPLPTVMLGAAGILAFMSIVTLFYRPKAS